MHDSYYMILPDLPTDGQSIYNGAAVNSIYNQAQAWVGQTLLSPPPYVFFKNRTKALARAQELTKQHHRVYYVAQINIMGQYIPPPPEWQPAYSDIWTKPLGDKPF